MFSPLANPKTTNQILMDAGLDPKYSFGQNFLVNDAIIGKIIKLANIKPGSKVIEVGPGLGTLSIALLEAGVDLFALELDVDMYNIVQINVKKYTSNNQDNFRVYNMDALKPPYDKIIQWAGNNDVHLVSNLPYSVAASIILDYYQNIPNLKTATVMVQREVAQRIMAKPNTKNYGAYTVKLAMYAKADGHFRVSCNNFMPPPRVESAVVRLVRDNSQTDKLIKLASEIATAAFSHRRKTIANSIKQYYSSNSVTTLTPSLIFSALESANISSSKRAENLTVNDFLTIASYL